MIKSISHQIIVIFRLIIERLPRIALATVSIALIVGGGQFLYAQYDKHNVQAEPAETYLHYTAFTVNNAREGEDITYTVCRDHDKNYHTTGIRTVYVVPEGKNEKDRIYVYNTNFDGVVEGGNCQSYEVKQSEHHFTAGRYQLTLNVDFNVDYGIKKSTYIKSSIFTVYAQPTDSTNFQAQINNLSAQLEELKQRLGVMTTPVVQSSPRQTSSSTGTSATSSNSQGNGNGNQGNTQQATPAPKCTKILFLCLGIGS